MAKSKHAPALFEVIDSHSKGKKQDNLALPKWWKTSSKEAGSKETGSKETDPENIGKSEESPPSTPADATASAEPKSPDSDDRKKAHESMEGPVDKITPDKSKSMPLDRTTKDLAAEKSHSLSARPAAPRGTDLSGGSTFTADGDATQDDGDDTPEPVVHYGDGRLVLSLSLMNLVIASGGLLILFIITFQIGKLSSAAPLTGTVPNSTPSEQVDGVEIPDVRKEQPDPSVLATGEDGGDSGESTSSGSEGTARGSVGGTAPPTARTESEPPRTRSGRESGLNYIILQYFNREDRSDAEHARQWLASKGVGTTLERSARNGGWLLISQRGFDYDQSGGKEKAESLADEIVALGKDYRREFGAQARYTFHAPFIKKEP